MSETTKTASGRPEPDCGCNRCELIRVRAELAAVEKQLDPARIIDQLTAANYTFADVAAERDQLKQQNDKQAQTIAELLKDSPNR